MKDFEIAPYKSVKLPHRIDLFETKDDNIFAFWNEKAGVSLLDKDFNIITTLSGADIGIKEIRFLKFHPHKDEFCVGGKNQINFYDLAGNLIRTEQGSIEAIFYSESTDIVWKIKRINNDEIKVSLFENETELDNITLEDELGQSIVRFNKLPEANKVCLMLLGGQDGMLMYFLTSDKGKIQYQQHEDLEETCDLNFSEDQTKFITMDPYEMDKITCLSYPKLEIQSEFLLPDEYEENECLFGCSTLFIDNTYALIEVGENMHYIFNTETSEIEAPFIITGHEPKPVNYYWPTLKDDTELTTNLSQFHKTPKYFIATFKLPENKEDNSIVILNKEDILTKIKTNIK